MSTHILIADDNAILCSLLQMRLEEEGFAVTCVQSWEEIVPAIKTHPIDAVLLDATLLSASQWTVHEAIRAEANIPTVLLVTPGAEELQVRFAGTYVNGVLVKPFRLRDLLNCLQSILGNSRANAA